MVSFLKRYASKTGGVILRMRPIIEFRLAFKLPVPLGWLIMPLSILSQSFMPKCISDGQINYVQ